jgi:hypothetical protein
MKGVSGAFELRDGLIFPIMVHQKIFTFSLKEYAKS